MSTTAYVDMSGSELRQMSQADTSFLTTEQLDPGGFGYRMLSLKSLNCITMAGALEQGKVERLADGLWPCVAWKRSIGKVESRYFHQFRGTAKARHAEQALRFRLDEVQMDHHGGVF